MYNYTGRGDSPLIINNDVIEVTIDVKAEDLIFLKLDNVTNVDDIIVSYLPQGSDTPVELVPSLVGHPSLLPIDIFDNGVSHRKRTRPDIDRLDMRLII